MFTFRLCGGVFATSSPSSRMRPLVGCSKPAIMRRVVVLPQPDGPTIVKNSPGGMNRSMPSTATTPPPKRLDELLDPDLAALDLHQTSIAAIADAPESPELPAKRR